MMGGDEHDSESLDTQQLNEIRHRLFAGLNEHDANGTLDKTREVVDDADSEKENDIEIDIEGPSTNVERARGKERDEQPLKRTASSSPPRGPSRRVRLKRQRHRKGRASAHTQKMDGEPLSNQSSSPTQENARWVYERHQQSRSFQDPLTSQDMQTTVTAQKASDQQDETADNSGEILIKYDRQESPNDVHKEIPSDDTGGSYQAPRTPFHANPFKQPGSVLAPSQLFWATQPTPARDLGSIASNRPSPSLFNNFRSPEMVASSPLGKGFEPLTTSPDVVSSPMKPHSSQTQDPGPEALSVSQANLTQTRRQLVSPYITRKESQERKRRKVSPVSEVDSQSQDWYTDLERSARERRRKRIQEEAALRELSAVQIPREATSIRSKSQLLSEITLETEHPHTPPRRSPSYHNSPQKRTQADVELPHAHPRQDPPRLLSPEKRASVEGDEQEVVYDSQNEGKRETRRFLRKRSIRQKYKQRGSSQSSQADGRTSEDADATFRSQGHESNTSMSEDETEKLPACSKSSHTPAGSNRLSSLRTPRLLAKSSASIGDTTIPETSPPDAAQKINSSNVLSQILEPKHALEHTHEEDELSPSRGAQTIPQTPCTERLVDDQESKKAEPSQANSLRRVSRSLRRLATQPYGPTTEVEATPESTAAQAEAEAKVVKMVSTPCLRSAAMDTVSVCSEFSDDGRSKKTRRVSRRLAPSQRTRSLERQSMASTTKSTPSRKLRSNLFTNMAFAVSYVDNHEEKRKVVQLITAHGGRILEDGFEELFEGDIANFPSSVEASELDAVSLRLTPEAMKTGFVSLIADKHSRRAKYMQALALNLPCLSGKWILNSVAKDAVINFRPYLLCAGESSFLGTSCGRTLLPYPAETAEFISTFESREKLMEGKSILFIMGKGRVEERNRKAYAFLTLALGASKVKRVTTSDEARRLLLQAEEQGGKWDWVYTDESDEDAAEQKVFGAGQPAKKTRKRKSANSEEGRAPKKVQMINDEFVIQSLIIGSLLE